MWEPVWSTAAVLWAWSRLDCSTREKSCSLRTNPTVFVPSAPCFVVTGWAMVKWVWDVVHCLPVVASAHCILGWALPVSLVRRVVCMYEVSVWLTHRQREVTKAEDAGQHSPGLRKVSRVYESLPAGLYSVPRLMILELSHTGFPTPEGC